MLEDSDHDFVFRDIANPDIENFWGKTTSFTKFLEARGGI
jgi:hypothetical protein